MAKGCGLSPREYRDHHTLCGGTQLLFDGPPDRDYKRPACRQYRYGFGCSVHAFRPLACRLYPLGRKRRDGEAQYYHPTEELGCLKLCPNVVGLPLQTVRECIAGQDTALCERAQDGYATVAFGLLSGAATIANQLAASGEDPRPLTEGLRALIALSPEERVGRLAPSWLERLVLPEITVPLDDPAAFAAAHAELFSECLKAEFRSATPLDELSRTLMLLALHLAGTVGCEPDQLWEIFEPLLAPS
jgi:Fe-S-cluster containining protein